MKKWTKFLCCFCLMALVLAGGLAGCATVSDIKNTYNEIIYNGTSAVRVEDYLYFGNTFSSISGSEGKYTSEAKNAYLARVDVTDLQAKNKYFSPKSVKTVTKEVTAYAKNFMFVLGQYIYYATPNTQMVTTDGSSAHNFDFTTFYRSRLNGDGKRKLFTTTATVEELETLKYNGTYYIVMKAGSDLITINLKTNAVTTLAENVTSVALPKTYQKDLAGSTLDWNGYVYFTTARSDEGGSGASNNLVKRILISETDKEKAETIYTQGTVTLLARERDVVFFSESNDLLPASIYSTDLTNSTQKGDFGNYKKPFVTGSSLTDMYILATKPNNNYGYVFTVESTLRFVNNSGAKGTITLKNGDDTLSSYKILFVNGRTVYLSTTSGVFSADLSQVYTASNNSQLEIDCKQIVGLSDVYDGAVYGFDGEYVYFYAKLQTVPEEYQDEKTDGEEDQTTEESDDKYYLHRARVFGTDEFELIGLATSKDRRTK